MSALEGLDLSSGWLKAMGIEVLLASAERVELTMEVGAEHLQPAGLVHGGVFSGLIETACSVGALATTQTGHSVVGVENHTSFIRPAKSGTLRCHATPVHSGRRSQLWQADVVDEQQRVLATGRVRLFSVPDGAPR